VLALRREVNGLEPSLTLSAMSDLAFSYRRVGRTNAAMSLIEEVLATSREKLDPEHPPTLLAITGSHVFTHRDEVILWLAHKEAKELLTGSR
jgi:hypothetical protein